MGATAQSEGGVESGDSMPRNDPIGAVKSAEVPLWPLLSLSSFRATIVLVSLILVPGAFSVMSAHSSSSWFWLPLIVLGGAEFALVILLVTAVNLMLFLLFPADFYRDGLLGTAVVVALALGAYRKFGLWVDEGTPRGDRYKGFQPYIVGSTIALTAFFAVSLFFRNLSVFESAAWMTLYGFTSRSLPRLAPRARIQTSSVIVLVLSSICSLLLLEAGARLLWEPPQLNAAREPHEEAIFMLKPKASGRYLIDLNDQTKREVLFQISTQGLRNEYVPEKAPDEFRILLLGDSYTMGHGLRDDETFAHLLQRKLDKGFPLTKLRVINGGVGGYAPWQERIFLNERGFVHEPDLVILQLFPPNDVEGSTAKTNERLQAFNPEWNQVLRNYKRRNELPFATERWLVRHSRAYERLTKIMDRNGPAYSILSNFRLIPHASYPSLIPQTKRPYLAEVCLRDWYPELYRAWERYADDILGIASDCKERGIAIAVFAHSDINSLYPENWERLNQRWAETPYEMNKDIRLTAELCKTNDIPYIDVLLRMVAHGVPEEIFFKHDGHFAPTGARLVAEALYNYVTSRHLANP